MTLPALELQEVFVSDIAATVPTWETVASSYTPTAGGLRAFEAAQGKDSDLDQDAAGTATFVVDVRDRELDPSNAGSSHSPHVTPNRPIRLAVGYVAEVLRDNPRSYWRLGELTTAQFYRDEQRTSYVTGVNTPTVGAAGVLVGNYAVSFASASSEYIDTGDLSLWDTGDATYELWIKTSTSGTVAFSEGNSGSSNGYMQLATSSGVANVGFRNDVGTFLNVGGSTNIVNNAWHHIVAVKGGSTVSLYVDGQLEGTPTATTGVYTVNQSRIGCLGRTINEFFFNGTIDEVAVYETALSAARVLAHYNAGHTGIGGYVHSGYVDAHNISYRGPHDAIVTIPSTDRFKLLSRAKLTGMAARPEEEPAVRIQAILGQVGLGFNHFLWEGHAVMMAEDISDRYALDAILEVAETENGGARAFVDKNGRFEFVSRRAISEQVPYTTPQATFSDSGAAGVIPYTNIVFENSDTLLKTIVEADHPVFPAYSYQDPTAIDTYGALVHTLTVRDATPAAQAATAEEILFQYRDPHTRVLEVTVPTSRVTATYPYGLYGRVISLALGMRVTVERTPPGGGAPISQECFIVSQSHSCNAETQNWTTTFGLALAPDTPSYGMWDDALWDTENWGY